MLNVIPIRRPNQNTMNEPTLCECVCDRQLTSEPPKPKHHERTDTIN